MRPFLILILIGSSLFGSTAPKPINAGTTLEAADERGNKVQLRIESVELDSEDKEIHLYSVSVLNPETKEWGPFCEKDANGVAKAIPLLGTWDEAGNHLPSDTLITFACTVGVLAKCARWGYKPWKKIKGKSLQPWHQACTRLARADYCGNGQHHTKEGTRVDIYDTLKIQKKGHDAKMRFEAAWGPDGATYLRRTRWGESLDQIEKECPDKLKGKIDRGEKPLDQKSIRNKWAETLLFNDSYERKTQ